jgi:hypothetical protein
VHGKGKGRGRNGEGKEWGGDEKGGGMGKKLVVMAIKSNSE